MSSSKNANNITGANGSFRPTVANVDSNKQHLAGDPAFAKGTNKFQEELPTSKTAGQIRMDKARQKKVAKGDLKSPVNPPLSPKVKKAMEEEEKNETQEEEDTELEDVNE